MIKVLIGNIFDSAAKTLVNTVNCVGIMGKGIALEFKKKYPEMYKDYVKKCKLGEVKPGLPYYYCDILGNSIINFPTKDDWRSVSNINYIIDGLKWFIDNYKTIGITSIAFPPLGCGNGGLLWEDVGPIMYKALSPLPIDIEIYAPYGTRKEQLSLDFLSDYKSITQRIGQRAKKFNPNWVCILEIIDRLNKNPFAAYIGRTTYQKICYITTLEGIKTDFEFRQGAYGPYSAQAKEAFIQMSNANLLHEERRGQLDSILINENYYAFREKNRFVVEKYKSEINKITDIFYRIKNTSQAEMYTTIIYSYNKLKSSGTVVKEKDILDYVLEWKPHWNNRIEEISNSIREISFLNIINVMYSDNMPGIFD